MPHLPFTPPTPSPSTSPTTPNPLDPQHQPSILLHPTPEPTLSSPPPRSLYQSTAQISSAYRKRYASYLAATFNINLEAAAMETEQELERSGGGGER
ncbi:hypothetical protein K432DRAFT_401136 [Lepidopterella palustris CBS 459.81]|uniref:Uncharacterized protein n=1 Tax=Lepidopterella palustris CBS 459.81 TaxID=1314670 RepID=A0A8E2EI53_9PEZI|nr:hypothetical protein K432DRAFT_401136 [Lepidopterella palustris CBS 459.81]